MDGTVTATQPVPGSDFVRVEHAVFAFSVIDFSEFNVHINASPTFNRVDTEYDLSRRCYFCRCRNGLQCCKLW